MDLKNSTILVTGGTSGIGLELVRQLTEIGAQVIVTGRNSAALNETKRRFPSVHTFQSDISKPDNIRQLYNDVTAMFPELNILINNAGEMRLIDMQETSMQLEDLTREIDINLSGIIRTTHKFLPHLIKKQSAAIVNVSSAIAFMAYSTAPVYSASKAGVHAFTMALRLQLKDTGVKVLELIPPGVKTNLQNNWALQPNPGQMMDVDKLVKIAIRGIQNDNSEIKPTLVRLIKFVSRIMPGTLMNYGHREFEKFRQLTRNPES